MFKKIEKLSHMEQLYVGLVCINNNDQEGLRKIARSHQPSFELMKMVKTFNYSNQTKNTLLSTLKEMEEKMSVGDLIDLILDYAKALELENPSAIFEKLIATEQKKNLNKETFKLISHYFPLQKGSSISTGTLNDGSALLQILDNQKEITIHGQEEDEYQLAIAEMGLQLNGYTNVNLKSGNYLTTARGEKVDAVYNEAIAVQKFTAEEFAYLEKDDRYNLYGLPSRNMLELAYVINGIEDLKATGKGAFIAVTSTLKRKNKDEKIRERMVFQDIVEAVIELPENYHSPTMGVSTSILLINKDKQADRKGRIMFINFSKSFEKNGKKVYLTEEAIKLSEDILSNWKEVKGISKIVDVAELDEQNLVPSEYIFETTKEIGSYGEVEVDLDAFNGLSTVPLHEVSTILRGYNALSKDEDEAGNVAVLKITDIENQQVVEEHLTRYQLGGRVKIDQYRLEKGDFILSVRGQIKMAVFDSSREDVLLSQNFVAIRCNKKLDAKFLKLYFESPTMQFIMQNKMTGTSVKVLPLTDIEEFRVPILPINQQQEIVAKYEEKQLKLKAELEEVLNQMKQTKHQAFEEMGIGNTYSFK